MMSVHNTTAGRKPVPRAYYAVLDEDHGILTQGTNGVIYFMTTETGTLVTIEPTMVNFLTVLGEIGLAETQDILDRMAGGYARIACTRQEGVA